MKRIILLSLFLSACSGRIEPPAPVEDKHEEMFGPKPISRKLKQDQMVASLIEKYGINSNASPQESSWPTADISSNETEVEQIPLNEPLPQPLKSVPAPIKKVEYEVIEPVVENAQKESVIEKEPTPSKSMIWPVKGEIIKSYGPGKDGVLNDGISIQAKEGTPVLAVADGTVAYSTNKLNGLGNLIFVTHPDGFISVYAHLKKINVVKGDKILQGENIGTVGKTGTVKTPQLYFELRKKGSKKVESFDPTKFLKDKG
jgi:murein DD-endopeptidase MepM/ murein hydrolase activator NlpD